MSNRIIKFRAWYEGKMVRWESLLCIEQREDNKVIAVVEQDCDGIATHFSYEVMQFTGLHDKNGKEIYEGDVVLGTKSWCDGYLRKKYPKQITGRCVIEFRRGAFEVVWKGAIPEHREFEKEVFYRALGYLQGPTSKGAKSYNVATGEFDIEGDDMTCPNLEVIGNIYENPNLLTQ